MKKLLYLSVSLIFILFGCNPKPAMFTVNTKNFDPNSVISIYSPETGQTYKVENITNSKQNFKINLPKKGYATLRTESGEERKEYWFYLDEGTFEINLDGKNNENYPFKSAPSEEGEDFIAFYKFKDAMSKNLIDSLNIAKIEMDHSTRENVMEKARNLDNWMEKKDKLNLTIIEAYAKKTPNFPHTIFLLDQLGLVDTRTEAYVRIFNSLDNNSKESKAGKDLLEQITRSSRMMVGSQMPNIEGKSPDGNLFSKKTLKKVNLVIVWTSYNTKSRQNNKMLTTLYKDYKNKDVEFIGVSLDKKRDWWVNVIKDDKLEWPQFSDLKGAKSPNAKNLSDYNIPYFFIIDKEGKVLMNNDLTSDFINDEIKKRL